MAKAVQLPDGSWFPLKEGENPEQALAEAEKLYPDAFGITTPQKAAPKGGIAGGFGKGLESLLSTYQTAAGAITSPEEAAQAALKRQQALGEKYEDAASLERVKKAYEEQGLLSAAKEVASQVPGAIAEQLPQLGTLFGGARLGAMAGARLGAMAGAPFGPAGSLVGGIGGAGAALLPQFFGSNIERQAAEQQATGQPLDIDRGSALASAAGQTALEAAGTAFVFGGRLVSKLTGISEKALMLGKGPVEKVAEERLRSVLAKGVAKGFIAELPVEIGQQMLERAQAGLPLADADALSEYGQTAYQVGLLAPLGAVGRLSERAGAREEVAKKRQEEAAAAAQLQEQEAARLAQEQEQYRQTPEYLDDVQKRYDALVAQKEQLEAATKVKAEGTDPASMLVAEQQKKAAKQALDDFKAAPEYDALVQEYAAVLPTIREQQRTAEATEKVFGQEPTYEAEDVSDAAQATAIKKQIDTLKKQQEKLTPAEQQPLQNRINALEDRLSGLVPTLNVYTEANRQLEELSKKTESALVSATSLDQEQRLTDELNRIDRAKAELQKFKPFIKAPSAGTPTYSDQLDLLDQMDAAKAAQDPEAIRALVPKLAAAQQQGVLPFATGYESDIKLAEEQAALGEEMAKGREEAAKNRAAVERETQALFRMGERGMTPFQMGLRKSRLDEARALMRQVSKPSKEGLRVGKPIFVQPGGALNRATRANLLVRENEQDWASFDKEMKENAFRVDEREALRDQLKQKLKDLKKEYDSISGQGESPALQLVQTETAAIENALAQVERKLKLGVEAQRLGQRMVAGELYKPKIPEKGGLLYKGKVVRPQRVGLRDMGTEAVEASDAAVAELINRLLGPASEYQSRVDKAGRPLADMQPSLFDIEAQKQIAVANVPKDRTGTRRVAYDEEGFKVKDVTVPAEQKTTRQRVSETPIEQAENLLQRIRETVERLQEYNQRIKEAGQLPNIEKMQEKLAEAKTDAQRTKTQTAITEGLAKIARVNELKDLRDFTERDLAALQKSYAGITQRQTATYKAADQEPGTGELFGGLEEARTEQNRIQNKLDKLYADRDRLKADLERRGQVGETPELQALVERYRKDTPQLQQLEDEIVRQEAELERVSGKTSARFDDFIAARTSEQEQRQEDTRTKTLPGFERRAGVRPVEDEQMRKAITELVELETTGETLRKAQASGDANPTKFLRELAGRLQNEYEAFLAKTSGHDAEDVHVGLLQARQKEDFKQLSREKQVALLKKFPIEPATERNIEHYENVRKRISYLNNVIKGNDRRAVDAAVKDNYEKQQKARDKIAQLERRQRAYEQQEAVRAGDIPGTAEAQRLIEGGGYRTAAGIVRTKPKNLKSWGVTAITKKTATPVPNAKVEMTSRALRAYEKATEAEAKQAAAGKQSIEEQIKKANKNAEKMQAALQQVYSDTVAKETEAEIEKLLATGLTPEQQSQIEDMAQTYAALKAAAPANDTIGAAIARLTKLKEEIEAKSGRFGTKRGTVFLHRNEVEDEILGRTPPHKKTKTPHIEALKDITHTIGKYVVEARRKGDPWTISFNALIKEKNANALLASQELGFAQLEFNAAERRLQELKQNALKTLEQTQKEKDSPTKAIRLATAQSNFERMVQGLPINNNEYNNVLEAYSATAQELEEYQFKYKKARLEQLNLLKAYGEDIQSVIQKEQALVQELTPQLEAKAKESATAAEQFRKAAQARAKADIAERAEKAAPPKDELAEFKYTNEERAALQRLREGLGLPGARYETDTTSVLVTKTKAAIRQTLTLREAELAAAKAPAENAKAALAAAETAEASARTAFNNAVTQADIKRTRAQLDKAEERLASAQATELASRTENEPQVRALTETVQALQRAYESVVDLGRQVVTYVGEGAEDRTTVLGQPKPVPGERLAPRRVGPLVRVGTQPPSQMLSGTKESRESISKGNRAKQAGTVRLLASGMRLSDASAIGLAITKQRLDASSGQRKADLETVFNAATHGMTQAQIDEKIKDGESLIKLPGAAAVVAAREQVRVARDAFNKADADVVAASKRGGYAKEMAEETREFALAELDKAEARLEAAENAVAAKVEINASAKTQAEKALDSALEQLQTEKTGKEKTTKAQRAAKEAEGEYEVDDVADVLEDFDRISGKGIGDEYAVEYTTATRTEPNPAVREAILDGRLVEALERLAVDSSNPLIRESAKDLSKLVLRTKVLFDPNLTVDGKPAPAKFNSSNNAITFRPEEITEEDIVHEATHAATMRVIKMPDDQLTPKQRNAKKELTAIYNNAAKRKDLKSQYGISKLEEFVSEMQSNVEFRAAMNNEPWYKRFWHAFVRLFSSKPIETVTDHASRLIKEMYLPSAKIAEPGGDYASIFRGRALPESSIVGGEPGKIAQLKGNLFGLSGRVQYIDRLAAADAAIVRGEGAGKLSSTEAFNAQYFMRMGDKVTQASGQFITNGPVRIVADKVGNNIEYRYESVDGATLLNVSSHIERAAKAGGMTPEVAETMLTVLIAGQRASAVTNGWERLQAKNPAAAKAEYDQYVNRMNSNPAVKSAMEAAMKEYKKYNEGLLEFAAQCGYLSKDEVRRLNKQPFVPFYRVEDGNVKLFVLGERPITIGNIKDSPDLAQFLGDEKKIQPILTSAVQNTFMLTRMAMHNKATMETNNALYKAGFVSKMGKGAGLANPSTSHYKIDGEDHFATIDADTFGIPAELIVRGMEGIKTAIPDLVKMMGVPADVLRKFITRSPAYAIRQLVREPMNAFIISGVDGVPMANALKELAKMHAGRSPAELALMRGLVVSSNIYTGGEADMQKFLNDVASGRSGWDKFLGRLDTMALQADASTRAVIYNDSLKKGFSRAKAEFRAMESANFGRRGLSPSMQWLSTMIPFFNAQIQGLDVLYRSLRGEMPFAQQLEIQRKIVARGAMLFATSMAYALMMQDDEAYKKAKPEERYGNFFVRIPGVKDPLKIPVPFETGLFFMGLPQALVDAATGSVTGKEAVKGVGKQLLNSLPGVIPAAPKPILEAFYGQTGFGPIESQREKQLEASERFRPGTTEVAKTLGSFTGAIGVSPLMIEHFVRGYTGSLGVALMSTLNPILRSAKEGEPMPVGASKQSFIGGLFQPEEGRFLRDRAYDRMEEVIQAQQTYKDLLARGQRDRASAFAKEKAALIQGASAAGSFRQRMGELFKQERQTMADPRLTGPEKEARVQRLKDAQNRLAVSFYAATERTTRP